MTTTKVFNSGRTQLVRLPKGYRFDVDDVCITKLGHMVVLYPPGKEWDILKAGIDNFTDDFLATRDQPTRHERRAKL